MQIYSVENEQTYYISPEGERYGFGQNFRRSDISNMADTEHRQKPAKNQLWSMSTSRRNDSTHIEYKPFTGRIGEIQFHSTSAGYIPYHLYFSASDEKRTDIVDLLVLKIRSRVKDQRVNLALSIKESRQAINMVNKLAKDALNAYRRLRRRGLRPLPDLRKSRPGSLQDEAANRWLELQFGWKPLLSDIYGLTEHALKEARDEGVYIYGREWGRIKVHESFSDSDNHNFFSNTSGLISGSAVFRYKVTNDILKQSAELGFTDIPALLWESVPYSFVFDALYDVGGWLHGLDSLYGVSDFSWQLSHRVTLAKSYTATRTDFPLWPSLEARGDFRLWQRTMHFDLPYGRPQWNSKAPSIIRLTNYLALLRQLR